MTIFSVDPMDSQEEVIPQKTLSPANIKVIGTGSGGTNAINHMINSGLSGVGFIAVNTDKQHLDEISEAEIKLHIGDKHTGGRGAGGDPLKGEDAAKEDRETISEKLRGSDMVFITTGMGGGTGTGSIPIIAKIAKEHGALVVGVVTTPFKVEGDEKMEIAETGIKKLREEVDTLIVIPNENLFKMIDSKTSVRQALRYADDILYQAVKGISDLITKTGLINTDFADVESTMKGQGDAHLGIGIGSGDNRAVDAANSAIDNPLLEDVSIEGATRILINIAGPEEFPMMEVREILNTVRTKVGAGAKLKFGITFDPDLGEDVKVTVIATGFQNKRAVLAHREETARKTEAADVVIDIKRFDEMRGLRDKRNDSYVGIMRQKDYNDNLEVPTAIRKYNPESDSGYSGKIAANGKDV
jgi:cell division protein FtsZ